MPDRNDPIPFETNAIRNALGDLAANGAGYVRLGALRLMASIMGMTKDDAPDLCGPQADPRYAAALNDVETVLQDTFNLGKQAQPDVEGSDTQSDAGDGAEQDEQDEQQEADDDDDEPP